MINIPVDQRARYLRNCRIFSALSAVAGLGYLKWLLLDAKPENWPLYLVLVFSEVFNIAQAAGFWWTISTQRWTDPRPIDFSRTHERVDIFITVCGEPLEIVTRTLEAALAIRHPRTSVWVLDDGKSTDVRVMTRAHGAGYLTRETRRGAKAGNINDALAQTDGHFVVIFDADHVPVPSFLEETMGVFLNRQIAFVQTPQAYGNRNLNRVSAGAHEQQELFYGPILRGRNNCNAVFACGTNLVFRRSALEGIGGLPEDSITEDLRVSLLLLKAGYRSEYVSKVLASGMGPVDVGGFFSQQLRWARGGLEILFRRKPFFRGMGAQTTFQYALSFMYWFTGPAFAGYIILPVTFLLAGVRPVQAPNQYPVYFVPYILIALWTIVYASGFKVTFRALWFTLAAFPVHIAALVSSLSNKAASFVVTSKGAAETSLRPVIPQVFAVALLAAASAFGIAVQGATPAVMNNVAFALGEVAIIQGLIRYALQPNVIEVSGERLDEPHTEAASEDAQQLAPGPPGEGAHK